MRALGNCFSGDKRFGGLVVALLIGVAGASQAFASPICDNDQWQPIGNNDQQVLQWKQSVPNAWLGRAHIYGNVVAVLPDATGHNHYIVQIGPNAQTDVIELIYSYEFGALPQVGVGMPVEACGDFIQSYARSGPYAPSPAGAIVTGFMSIPLIAILTASWLSMVRLTATI